MSYNPAATRHENHPGMDAAGCPLRETVVARPCGTSENGFRCGFTGGHCLPGDYCASRIERARAEADAMPEVVSWG